MLRSPRRPALSFFLLTFALGAFACGDDPEVPDAAPMEDAGPADPPAPAPFADVEQAARFTIPGLSAHAHVVRTEANIPHVYAENRLDGMRVLGFAMATDRFFQMDLTARLAQGTLSELLGDAALATDLETRQTGAAFVTDRFLAGLDDEEGAEADAFAEGVNAYIEAVRARQLPPPTELELAAGILGARRATDLMHPWDRRDVIATGATVLYATSFETGDLGRADAFSRVDTAFEGLPKRELRLAGLRRDVIEHVAPPNDNSSAAGFGLETAGGASEPFDGPVPRRVLPLGGPRLERSMQARLRARAERIDRRLHPNGPEGYGSNVWAVMGSATRDGRALLAGDGHLQLSVPALFWQYGVDTVLLGGADGQRLRGATIAGLPLLGVGTNGRVAWSQTAYFADVTDWYTEEVVLDAAGAPTATRFRGEDRPLSQVGEVFEVADVPALDSVGRTETVTRYVTFDGRLLTAIEGRELADGEEPAAGESVVNVMGDRIVPMDMDGDDVIGGVSLYYGPFDGGSVLRAFRGFADANSVEDFREAMRHFIGYGGSMMAADASGSVMYSAYHAVPCRTYLPRDPMTNVWMEGADPRRLLDGTQHGAWSLPLDARGRVDEAAAASGPPEGCAVPFERWPAALDPERQYVMHANNDPGNIATDNDLFDDPYYIGGPWLEGYRARRIEQRLQAAVATGETDVAEMASIQGDHHSNLGEDYAGVLLDVIAAARAASEGSPAAGSAEERMAARYSARAGRFDEVATRVAAWRDAGFPTPSGVETFYSPAPSEDAARASVATTIFAHWFPRFIRGILDDEGIDRSLSLAATSDTFRLSLLKLLLENDSATLGSFDPETGESVFFDDVRTPEVESSQEIALRALDDALVFLEAAPEEPGVGGFGTEDMEAWRWGLRHQVRFESLLAEFLGDDPALGVLLNMFRIGTRRLPLAPDLADDDPRAGIPFFPRPGDQFDVDAANPGLGGVRFTHGSGPVFRLVVSIGEDGVSGQNILPGGQSGLPASDFFDDQAQRWLANETLPLRYLPEEVAAGAVSRERYVP